MAAKKKIRTTYNIEVLNGDVEKITEVLVKFSQQFGNINAEVPADRKTLVIEYYEPTKKCQPEPPQQTYAYAHTHMN